MNTSKKISITAFTILLLALFTHTAQAQKTWSIGPEAGLSLSKYREGGKDHDLKTGLVAGAHVTYSTQNTFGITLKALYHQKGSRYEVGTVEHKQRLNYLELPLMARFFLTESGRFRPNIFAGPTFGFLLGVKEKTGDNDFISVSDSVRDQYSSFDFGLTGGIGLNYLILKETRLLFDARYSHGLTDLYDPATAKQYNQGLALTLGLSFGLK